MLKIITVPDKRLRKISKSVNKLDKKTLKFIKKLGDSLAKKNDPPGVGLSAIQVGKPLRLFYTYLPPDTNLPQPPKESDQLTLDLFINPEIIARSKNKILGEDQKKPILEGCLSIPKVYGPVWRHQWVEIKYQIINKVAKESLLVNKKGIYRNFAARVIQHEIDHLDGILFTDHSLKDKLPLYEPQGDKMAEVTL